MIAFIVADLIVLLILDICRKYYGWKVSGFLLASRYVAVAGAALIVEAVFWLAGLIPSEGNARVVEASIDWNYTIWLKIAFLVLAGPLVWRFLKTGGAPRNVADDELTSRNARPLGGCQAPVACFGHAPNWKRQSMNRLLISVLVAFASAALAQSHQPYAGLEGRTIKVLSEQQVADLRAGRGMGLALAADLNGCPGPMHVLELADTLDLSGQQRAKMQELFAAMKAEAIPLGERLIGQEAEPDKAFAGKTITAATQAASTDAIGATHAALRQAHLKYHLFTVEVLTPAQIQRYAELRGYKEGTRHPQGRH